MGVSGLHPAFRRAAEVDPIAALLLVMHWRSNQTPFFLSHPAVPECRDDPGFPGTSSAKLTDQSRFASALEYPLRRGVFIPMGHGMAIC